jgi:GntR family transcriptional repressor for pyruvate dehydrogenase complex
MDALSTPLPLRPSAVDACAERIRRAILGGELAPGTRLPPERALAATFGVNRVTVRGALARLEQRRLLSVRQGSGYVVRDFRREGGPELIAGLAELASARDLAAIARDLLLVRRQVAAGVLARLAELPEVDASGVAAAIDGLAAAAARGAGPEELAQADLEVVAAVLAATGSPVLGLCMNPIQQVLLHMPALCCAIYAEPEGNVAGWRALLAWLAGRRGDTPHPERDAALVPTVVAELERRDALTVSRLARTRKATRAGEGADRLGPRSRATRGAELARRKQAPR